MSLFKLNIPKKQAVMGAIIVMFGATIMVGANLGRTLGELAGIVVILFGAYYVYAAYKKAAKTPVAVGSGAPQ